MRQFVTYAYVRLLNIRYIQFIVAKSWRAGEIKQTFLESPPLNGSISRVNSRIYLNKMPELIFGLCIVHLFH